MDDGKNLILLRTAIFLLKDFNRLLVCLDFIRAFNSLAKFIDIMLHSAPVSNLKVRLNVPSKATLNWFDVQSLQ